MNRPVRIAIALTSALLFAGCFGLVEAELNKPHVLEVVEEEDQFRDEQSWTVQAYYVEGGPESSVGLPDFMAFAQGVKHGPEHPESPGSTAIFLVFDSSSDDWRFLRDRDVDLLLDGGAQRLNLGEADRTGEVATGARVRVEERIWVPLSLEQLDAIAAANTVAVQAGQYRFNLRPSIIEGFGRLAAALRAEGF